MTKELTFEEELELISRGDPDDLLTEEISQDPFAVCPYCKHENNIHDDFDHIDDTMYETFCEACSEEFYFKTETRMDVFSYKFIRKSEED
jgi:hypothetical protein